jgi:hypothetical protein
MPCQVNTIADGECESAATIVYMAGAERYIMHNAVFRPHQGRFTVIGAPFQQAMYEALNWKKDENKARQIYLDETDRIWRKRNQSSAKRIGYYGKEVRCEGHKDCIVGMVETEIELNAQEVVEFGYADGIWTPEIAKRLVIVYSEKDDIIKDLLFQLEHLKGQQSEQSRRRNLYITQ